MKQTLLMALPSLKVEPGEATLEDVPLFNGHRATPLLQSITLYPEPFLRLVSLRLVHSNRDVLWTFLEPPKAVGLHRLRYTVSLHEGLVLRTSCHAALLQVELFNPTAAHVFWRGGQAEMVAEVPDEQ